MDNMTTLKFHSDTNFGNFIEGLDMRMSGSNYVANYSTMVVTMRDAPLGVVRLAEQMGATHDKNHLDF